MSSFSGAGTATLRTKDLLETVKSFDPAATLVVTNLQTTLRIASKCDTEKYHTLNIIDRDAYQSGPLNTMAHIATATVPVRVLIDGLKYILPAISRKEGGLKNSGHIAILHNKILFKGAYRYSRRQVIYSGDVIHASAPLEIITLFEGMRSLKKCV